MRKEYTILEAGTPDMLSEEVNRYLKTGVWFLVGGPYGIYNHDTLEEIHFQAMVKISSNRETKNVKKIQLRDVKKEPA